MSRFIALAASAMLLSLTSVPAMADDGLATAPLQPTPVLVLAQKMTTAPTVAQPALYAPLTSLKSTGLGSGAVIFGGLAIAGLAGIIALAATNDDDTLEATPTTN